MKRLFFYFIIFLLLGVPSCNKKDEIIPPDQFPEWLEVKISELTSESRYCDITDVTYIEYKGKLYYHIYCGLWSCIYCHLYDENGIRVNLEPTEWQEFTANMKEIKTMPACPE